MRKWVARLVRLFLALLGSCAADRVACPKVISSNFETNLIGRDSVRSFTEISGLVFSKKHVVWATGDPVLYAITDGHNNNGANGRGRIGAFNSRTGRRLVTLVLSNATGFSWDWESLTLGTCGPQFTEEDNCIYVGDIGDNVAINSNGRRNDRRETWPYRIIKIREPDLTNMIYKNVDVLDVPDSDVWILPFNYSHPTSNKPVADSEAIFLDHTGWGHGNAIGDIYVVPKWGRNNLLQNRLFKIPVEAWDHSIRGIEPNPWIGNDPVGNHPLHLKPEVAVGKNLRAGNRQSTTSFSIDISSLRLNSSSLPAPSSSGTTSSSEMLPQGAPPTSYVPSESFGSVSIDLSFRPQATTPAPSTGNVTFLPMYMPEVVGDFPEHSEFLHYQWTGADMTVDGMLISLSTSEAVVFFQRCPGETVAQAITGSAPPCLVLPNPAERFGMETSAWSPDGRKYLQIPEGRRPRMGYADMDRGDVGAENAKQCHSHPHFDDWWF